MAFSSDERNKGFPALRARVDFFAERREAILGSWAKASPVQALFERFAIAPADFISDYGSGICDHYLRVIGGTREPGNCPIMVSMVRFLKDRDFRTSDVFLLCSSLRRSFIQTLEETGFISSEEFSTIHREIHDLFDANLVGVFDMYTETISKKEREIQEYLQIIDQNVILSRTDSKGTIQDVSSAFCHISGFSREDLIGKSHNIIRHPDMPNSLFDELWKQIRQGRVWKGIIKNRSRTGDSYWVEATISPMANSGGRFSGYMSVNHDITDRIQSRTDPLTMISNRLHFDSMLQELTQDSSREKTRISLVLYDIDNFKSINDTMGHETGDAVLKQLTDLVRNNIRDSDFLARWGGEEFAIIVRDTVESAGELAERLRTIVAERVVEGPGRITCSFGVAAFQSGDSPESLFRRADAMLYRAKRTGKNRVISESPGSEEPSQGRQTPPFSPEPPSFPSSWP